MAGDLERAGAGDLSSGASLPSIGLDVWFDVEGCDLHRVVELLPSLDWNNTQIGVRVEFAPRDADKLLENFGEAKAKSAKYAADTVANSQGYHPWPVALTDYLKKRLSEEYRISYYVLDRSAFADNLEETPGYIPSVLGDSRESGARIMKSLLQVDVLTAQRHQADSEASSKSSNLSRRLGEIYKRKTKESDGGLKAVAALAQSEAQLNEHMLDIFGPTLKQLNNLGYPGFADPFLVIKSALNPEKILTESASVHYGLRAPENVSSERSQTLPDKYNGLGFKNLIYMVVEILEANQRWEDKEEDRPPLHLIIIEEPEAHLHVQLQQAFIRQVRDLLPIKDPSFGTQLIVTTHSPHIIYESNFTPIRYFRRASRSGAWSYSTVLNLSTLCASDEDTRRFLLQYMKLTHCDLFFADAAVLVEGNVERLLLPLMIGQAAPQLKSSYLSIIEVGGAFAYRFKQLVEFLGLTTLVITDLDSVRPTRSRSLRSSGVFPEDIAGYVSGQEPDDDADSVVARRGGVCMADSAIAVTSNQTLIKWLPGMTTIADLLAASDKCKTDKGGDAGGANVRVVFQTRTPVVWLEEKEDIAGRTFEEAFAFENLAWCQERAQKQLHLRVVKKNPAAHTLYDVVKLVHNQVKGKDFPKTEFAMALIMKEPADWRPPSYVVEGLNWLSEQLFPMGAVGEPASPASDEVAP
jgi:predicted ATP-dependent endonuclease of OLD family